jgi:hypothetical protein
VSPPRLSGLQRTVLALALANRETEGRDTDTPGADVTYAEILVAFYRWEPTSPLRRSDGSRVYGGQKFPKAEIGARPYAAALAAVSRAVKRLDDRGLVAALVSTRAHWSGAKLTDQGVQVARALNG